MNVGREPADLSSERDYTPGYCVGARPRRPLRGSHHESRVAVEVLAGWALVFPVRLVGFSGPHARLKPANRLTERLAEFGKPFRSKEDQRNRGDEEPMHRLQRTFKHREVPQCYALWRSTGRSARGPSMDESISSVLNEMPTGEARTAIASELHGPLEGLHDVVIQFGHRHRTTPRNGAGSQSTSTDLRLARDRSGMVSLLSPDSRYREH